MPETDLEKLKRLSAWEAEPALSEDDLEAILGGAALADINGLEPSHEAWTPTYDINAAAADVLADIERLEALRRDPGRAQPLGIDRARHRSEPVPERAVGAELADLEARGDRQQAGRGVDELEGELQIGSQELDQCLVEVAR